MLRRSLVVSGAGRRAAAVSVASALSSKETSTRQNQTHSMSLKSGGNPILARWPAVSRTILCVALALPDGGALAQQYPLLDSVRTNLITAEISGDAAFDHIRALSPYHRPQGSDTLYLAAQYVERMARAFGLDSVALIMQP